MKITVMLVEDHRHLREALRETLARESDIEILGEAPDAATALENVRRLKPAVVVLDTDLPGGTGIETLKRIACANPALRIVALSDRTDERYAEQLRLAGAAACVTKSAAGTCLVHAIRADAAARSGSCAQGQAGKCR